MAIVAAQPAKTAPPPILYIFESKKYKKRSNCAFWVLISNTVTSELLRVLLGTIWRHVNSSAGEITASMSLYKTGMQAAITSIKCSLAKVDRLLDE